MTQIKIDKSWNILSLSTYSKAFEYSILFGLNPFFLANDSKSSTG